MVQRTAQPISQASAQSLLRPGSLFPNPKVGWRTTLALVWDQLGIRLNESDQLSVSTKKVSFKACPILNITAMWGTCHPKPQFGSLAAINLPVSQFAGLCSRPIWPSRSSARWFANGLIYPCEKGPPGELTCLGADHKSDLNQHPPDSYAKAREKYAEHVGCFESAVCQHYFHYAVSECMSNYGRCWVDAKFPEFFLWR